MAGIAAAEDADGVRRRGSPTGFADGVRRRGSPTGFADGVRRQCSSTEVAENADVESQLEVTCSQGCHPAPAVTSELNPRIDN